jgi:hypothetical protein
MVQNCVQQTRNEKIAQHDSSTRESFWITAKTARVTAGGLAQFYKSTTLGMMSILFKNV